MHRTARFIVGLLALLGFTAANHAGVLKDDVQLVRHHVDGWTLSPAVHQGRVVGFLGWADAGTSVGNNICLMWFDRGAEDLWHVFGWSSADKGAAVQFVRSAYADPTMFSRDGLLVGASIGVEPVPPTDKVVEGFFETDPFGAAVLGTPGALEVAEALASLGYAVTAGELKASLIAQPCETEVVSKLDQFMIPIVRQVEQAVFTAESLAADRATEAEIDPCVAAWPCSGCTVSYGAPTIAPGAVTTTTVTAIGSRCKCESRTPATAAATYTGKTRWLCDPCTGPAVVSGEEYCAEDVECGVPIAATPCPGGGCGLFVPVTP